MAYFNIRSLENLSRDTNQSNYYDLFVQHYSALGDDVQLRIYVVDRSREMRLDLVCTDLYGDITNLQLLMFINNIDNPFGVQESDIIFWVDGKDISKVTTIDPKILDDGRDNLINAFKASLSDPSRNAYLQGRGADQLPPNVLPSNAPKIQIDNNAIIVGANLFTNPNNQVRNTTTGNGNGTGTGSGNGSSLGQVLDGVTDTSGNPLTGTEAPIAAPEENTERVLVRRFIRSGNS
jgi:hypothetical protein